jgi:hypothetical protein
MKRTFRILMSSILDVFESIKYLNILSKVAKKLIKAVHAYNPNPWEAEAGGSAGQVGLHDKFKVSLG